MNLIICKKRDMNKAVACANVYSDWLSTDIYSEISDFTLKEDQQFCHNIQESMTANAERMQGFSKAVEAGHGKPGQYQLVCDYSDQFLATDKGRMNTYYCCGGKTVYNMEKKKHVRCKAVIRTDRWAQLLTINQEIEQEGVGQA
eukprot:1516737-Pyramimonas_sp.AAC.1